MAEKLGFGPDIENRIISLCIKDTQFFLDIHEYLKGNHFVKEEYGKAYAFIQLYFDKWHSIPSLDIIKRELTNYGIDVDNLEHKDDNTLHRDYLLEETVNLIRHQEMKKFILKAATEVDSKDSNFEKLEEELRAVISIQPSSNLGTFYFDVDERYAKIRNINTDRFPTGIPSVDRALNGGLGKKELVCFAAVAGAGKSYMLAITGSNLITKGYNVVHYTLEMSEEITSLRYDNAIMNKTTDELLNDVAAVKEKLATLQKLRQNNLVIKEYPTKGASVSTIRAHLNKLKEQKSFIPDVVIIDYGDIMRGSRNFTNRYEEQGAIFQEMRGLAQEFDIPVLTATQANRGAVSKDVAGMEDLGDSFDKARIMDALFFILQKPEEKEDEIFRLYDAKVRNGRSGKITGYEINYAKASIKEIGEVEREDV